MIEQLQKQEQNLSHKQLINLKILQMNCLDLEAYIQEAALLNPVIDFAEEELLPLPVISEEGFCNDWDDTNAFYPGENTSDSTVYIPVNPFSETLERHLFDQLLLLDPPADQLPLLRFIIMNLDEHGYFKEDLNQLAQLFSVPHSFAEAALQTIQGMDPPGIAARTLEECLILQLKHSKAESYITEIVKNHLLKLAKKQFSNIAAALGIDIGKVQEAANIIAALDPKPGSRFDTDVALPYAVPDVICKMEDDQIRINTRFQQRPPFTINIYYQSLLASTEDEEVKKYLTERLRSASELLEGIGHRENTLKRCTLLLVEKQQEYLFKQGNKTPFTMTEAAKMLELHVSTVSRTVQGKYLQCPRGTLPLASLFCQPVSTAALAFSPDQIKARIRLCIEAERKEKPLSDQQITNLLKTEGFSLSRRAVAKYRGEMGIRTASERKNPLL